MSTRSARLLRLIDELSRRHRGARGADLAERLGVSLRTVYRDIETLREQGAEIDGEAGVGYRLRPGFMLPAMMFTEDELEAVVLGARWVAAHADPELAAAARSAMDRITGLLPTALRLQVETSGLLVPDWRRPAAESWLPALRRAIRHGHRVQMHYVDAQGCLSERRVWPFAMAFFSEARILAAWCELRGGFRHFRADRVQALADTGEPYPERRHQLLRRWRTERAYLPTATADET